MRCLAATSAAASCTPAPSSSRRASSSATNARYRRSRSRALPAPAPRRTRRGGRDGVAPRGVRGHARLAQVGERGRQSLREVGPVEDRAEVAELGGQALDQAPHEPLARKTGEHDRRRPPLRRDQVRGQAPEGGDPEVGHGSEAPDDEVADAGAHRGRADDHGDGRERVVAFELEDPLAERVLELRETAADEQPLVCVTPAGHGRGERITRPGRVGRPAGPRGRGAGGLRSARGRSPRARGARRGARRGRRARSRRSRSRA